MLKVFIKNFLKRCLVRKRQHGKKFLKDENFITCQPSFSTKLREVQAHRESVPLFKNCEFGDYPPKASAYDKDSGPFFG